MLFLLGSSKVQSRIKLRESFTGGIEVYPFQELTPKRAELINYFDVSMEELSPVWRRFKNSFWDSLEFWVLPPPVQSFIQEFSLVLSPLLGLIKVDSPIPYAPLSWEEKCKGVKLKDWWKGELKAYCQKLFQGQTVVSLLGKREEELLSFKSASQVVKFEFYKKGKKVMNPQRHRAYALRYIAEKRLSVEEFHRINFYDYRVKDVKKTKKTIYLILEGEGAYL
ncbi:peroxide stress protein YaaA [Thermocrinis sp.]